MKKNYFLQILAFALIMMLGISNTMFAQINLPFQSDFSKIGGNSDGSSGSNSAIKAEGMPDGFIFANSERIYEGGKKIRMGTSNDPGALCTEVINTNGASTIAVKFYAISWPSTGTNTIPSAKVIVVYGDQETDFVVPLGSWPITAGNLVECSFQFTGISTPTSMYFKTSAYVQNVNGSRIFIDNISIIDAGTSTQVANPTFSPSSGTYNTPQNVSINCATEGATIHYTTDGSAPTTSSETFSTPIFVENTTTIKAFAVKDGLDPSNVVSATYSFPQSAASLAQLRTFAPPFNNGNNPGSTVLTYTGKAVVTQKQTNNTIYIQDGTAAIMVYGNLLTDVQIGDKISNITGTLTNYFGMIELVPAGECDVVEWYAKVEPVVITASQLNSDNNSPIQAKIIRINNVLYTQTGIFESGKYYNLKENTTIYDSVVYTDNFNADYIKDKDPIPTLLVNIDGICKFTYNKNRIVPLDKSNNVVGIASFNQSAIQLSPNPATNYVYIVAGSPMKLEVYSLLGNLIAVENLYEGKNIISVSQYPAGMYLMKLTDSSTGQSYMQKLVVK
ncbi:MAG: chitobiase/beta-hexosaminidase C-terminal domain-containing protein [Bacteroidales bacterium]|jgi:hypothetical protein|nr:chitobiase/beta-hexosaminidase C-terminal domain-containing protein [Bacteroidales bacterium]